MMGQLIFYMTFSFISSVAFGVICNVPRRSLPISGLIGMIGWIGSWLLSKNGNDVFIASFVCSLLLAVTGQIAARTYKMPLTIFYIPGLAPIVPGITSYQAVRSLLLNQYEEALFSFIRVGYTAVGIACGLVVADIITRSLFFLLRKKNVLTKP